MPGMGSPGFSGSFFSRRRGIALAVVAGVLVSAGTVLAVTGLGMRHDGGPVTAGDIGLAGNAGTVLRAAHTARPGSGSASPRTPAQSPVPSPEATQNPAGSSGEDAMSGTAAPVTSASCRNPEFTTSQQFGIWQDGNYFVYNNMWNSSGYSVTQTLYACSSSNWYVVANMNNDSGNGAVKTYPNVQENFNEKPIGSFKSITSTFAETDPHAGIYEDAYDMWLNGVGSSGSTEVMIWTNNFHQVPGGSQVTTVSLDGRSYQVWKSGSYIAFVAGANFTSGTMNLLEFYDWIIQQGWIPASSTLGQIDYGAELVSTGGSPATFTFNNFSIAAS
jgi:hypothetical protein